MASRITSAESFGPSLWLRSVLPAKMSDSRRHRSIVQVADQLRGPVNCPPGLCLLSHDGGVVIAVCSGRSQAEKFRQVGRAADVLGLLPLREFVEDQDEIRRFAGDVEVPEHGVNLLVRVEVEILRHQQQVDPVAK
jgi:hypothetical protein